MWSSFDKLSNISEPTKKQLKFEQRTPSAAPYAVPRSPDGYAQVPVYVPTLWLLK